MFAIIFPSFSPLWLTLAVAAAAVLLLISSWASPDVVGLLTVVSLALLGVLSLPQALSGFSNPVIFVLVSIFILTAGLEKSGATAALGNRLAGFSGASEVRFVIAVMLMGAVLSLFMNTVAAAAVLLPPVLSVARRTPKFSPSRVLIPLAFSTLLGGTATLLTTANLVVSGVLRAHGYSPYGVLDFLPIGLPVTAVGLLYMVLVGRRLLPNYGASSSAKSPDFSEIARVYRLREGLHALRVSQNSRLIGASLLDERFPLQMGVTPVGLFTPRGFKPITQLPRNRTIKAGDVVVVGGKEDPQRFKSYGLSLLGDKDEFCLGFQRRILLAEIMPLPRSRVIGQALRDLNLWERYQALTVALWSDGIVQGEGLYDKRLEAGDAMLVLVSPEGLEALKSGSDFVVLETYGSPNGTGKWKMYWAGALMLIALVPAAAGWLPLALSALSAAVLALLTGVLTSQEAYRAISWETLFLIGGMMPLGIALRQSGAAAFLAKLFLAPLSHAPAWEVAAGFLLLTALLAQVTSGQVAALILAPLAIATAEAHGISPRGLGMAVAVGASFAFLLPTGHPVNLLVMSPGGYKPSDYFKVGLPLLLLVVPVAIMALQFFYLR